jgi:hypothetical protein
MRNTPRHPRVSSLVERGTGRFAGRGTGTAHDRRDRGAGPPTGAWSVDATRRMADKKRTPDNAGAAAAVAPAALVSAMPETAPEGGLAARLPVSPASPSNPSSRLWPSL